MEHIKVQHACTCAYINSYLLGNWFSLWHPDYETLLNPFPQLCGVDSMCGYSESEPFYTHRVFAFYEYSHLLTDGLGLTVLFLCLTVF